MSGTIPVELGQLSALKRLYLQSNDLTGAIPASLGDLSNLQFLYLHSNDLSGEIPSSLGSLSNLKYLYLQNNDLTGQLPVSFSNLTSATRLYLQNNELEGCIPITWDVHCGINVRLSGNSCLSHEGDFSTFCADTSCSLPSGCSCAPSQDYYSLIDLYNATGGGSWNTNTNWGQNCDISTWHGITTNSAGRVTRIALRENGLTGSIPSSLSDLSALTHLYLDRNALVGSIPSALGQLSNLKYLYLYNNDLSGGIPTEIGDLSKLINCYLHGNDLSGTIPVELGQLSLLKRLYLQSNDLTGTVPTSIGDLGALQYLYLQSNDLSGEIPTSLSNLSNLKNLYLQNNDLTGSLPVGFSDLTSANRIWLYNNDLEGCIPTSWDVHCGIDVRLQNNACLSHSEGDFAEFCLDNTCQLEDACLDVDYRSINILSNLDTVEQGNTVDVSGDIINIGSDEAQGVGNSEVGYYLSIDSTLEIGTDALLGVSAFIPNLAGGSTRNHFENVSIGLNIAPGQYYIIVAADNSNIIVEQNETNNTSYISIVVSEPAPVFPDYIISSVTPSLDTVSAGDDVAISGFIMNSGDINPNIIIPSTIGYYLSLDETYSASDILLGTTSKGNMSAGSSSNYYLNASIPGTVTAGQYYIVVVADIDNVIDEGGGESNNETAAPITILEYIPEYPDYVMTQTSVMPGVIVAGSSVDITGFIKNQGTVTPDVTNPPSTIGYYLSNDSIISPEDFLLGTQTKFNVFAGSSLNHFYSTTIPVDAEPGLMYVLVAADITNVITEADESNNIETYAVTVMAPPSCSDGIQNGEETGIDCGGSCDSCISCPNQQSQDKYDAFMALYNATDGPNWINNSGWGTTCDICNWYGVTCNDGVDLLSLTLISNNLNGSLPSEFFNLEKFQSSLSGIQVDLSNNLLIGSIPAEAANLAALSKLILSNNSLTGSIPDSLGTSAEFGLTLDLSNNQLSGEIPSALHSNNLNLSNNSLEGCIPIEFLSFCDGNMDLSNNACLSHNGGDFSSFCMGVPCEGSNLTCTTCSNGIQDPSETDVDCGGVCIPCAPNDIFSEDVTLSYMGVNDIQEDFDQPLGLIQNDVFGITYGIGIGPFTVVPIPINSRFVLSVDATYSIDDIELGVFTDIVDVLPEDDEATFVSRELSIPNNTPAGTYHILLKLNYNELITEADYDDNYNAYIVSVVDGTCDDGVLNQDEDETDCGGICFTCETLDISADGIMIFSFVEGEEESFPAYVNENGSFGMQYSLELPLTFPNPFPVSTRMVLSVDQDYSPDDVELAIFNDVITDQNSFESYFENFREFQLPGSIPIGSYYVILKVNHDEVIPESNYADNFLNYPITVVAGTCTDEILNGDETGVDCGGTLCDPCPTCDDGIQNGDETGVDCGGSCSACYTVDYIYDVLRHSMQSAIPATPGQLTQVQMGYQVYTIPPKSITSVIDFDFRVSIDPVYSEDDILVNSYQLTTTSSGSTEHYSFVFPVIDLPPGSYYLVSKMDVFDLIDETNENNNTRSYPIIIYEPAHCSDGILSGNEAEVDCGGSCNPCVEICDNNIDDDGDGLIDCADGDCDGQTGCVPMYDLAITDVSLNPSTIPSGGTATIDVSIANVGDADAIGSMELEYFVSEDGIYDSLDISVGMDSFAWIMQGDTLMLMSLITIPESVPLGFMNLVALVNKKGMVGEANALNNELPYVFNTIAPTCDDDTPNGDETGVDCGGSCPDACPTCPFPQEEVDALIALYEELGGPGWVRQENWTVGCDICQWEGIYCEEKSPIGYVLDLRNNNLSGVVPPDIGLLQNADCIQIGNTLGEPDANSLMEGLPEEISNLSNLTTFSAESAGLTGPLPFGLGFMTNLSYLFLNGNDFLGCIPSSYSNLCNTTFVKLFNNPNLSPDQGDFYAFCNEDNQLCNQAIGERGTTLITDQWETIQLDWTYEDPVIIAGPMSTNESDAAVLRIRNITETSFDIRIQEWDCEPGAHSEEQITYMVVDAGAYVLSNGSKLYARNTEDGYGLGIAIGIPEEYDPNSIVLSQVISENDTKAVGLQNTRISEAGNYIYDLSINVSKAEITEDRNFEDISVIIIEPGVYNQDDIFEYTNSSNSINHNIETVDFVQTYVEPILIGKRISVNSEDGPADTDPAEIRYSTIGSTSADFYINEDDNCGVDNPMQGSNYVHFALFDGPGLIYGSRELPDLALISISTLATDVSAGTEISIEIELDNLGSISVYDEFDINIYARDIQSGALYFLSGLPYLGFDNPTEPLLINTMVHIPYTLNGAMEIIGFVDAEDNIRELSELNNKSTSAPITVLSDPCSDSCEGDCGNACPVDMTWNQECGVLFSQSDFENRVLDVSLEVGATVGYPSVTSDGGATYAIPFPIPPGTNGMEPSLGVSYNSQAGNGMAGFGWNINGLSSISRIAQNHYYDASVLPVRMASTDAFALDGNRLLVTNGELYNSVTATYATQSEGFQRVERHGAQGNGPRWFEVKTKSGITIEFGNSEDSRYTITEGATDESVLFWNISKTIDNYGNYVEYKYKRENGELLLDQVLYTGNSNAGPSGLDPYNSLKFEYENRGDKNFSHSVGHTLNSNQRLSKVVIESKNEHVKTFKFCYASGPNGISALRSYLIEVQEFGSDYDEVSNPNSKYNATKFRYGDKTPNSEAINILAAREEDNIVSYKSIERERGEDYTRIGDLNGDGLDDIAVFRAKRQDNVAIPRSVEIYLKESIATDNFRYIGERDLKEYLAVAAKKKTWFLTFLDYAAQAALAYFTAGQSLWWQVARMGLSFVHGYISEVLVLHFGSNVMGGNLTLEIQDFNGDNRAEVLLYTPDYRGKNNDETLFTIGVDGSEEIILESYSFERPEKDQRVEKFLTGDFDGDTKSDFLLFLSDRDDDDNAIVAVMLGLAANNHQFVPVSDAIPESAKFFDFAEAQIRNVNLDGDGKTDLLVMGGKRFSGSRALTFYDLDGIPYIKSIYPDSPTQMDYPSDDYYLNTGDFNGDGLTDVLTSEGNGTWEIGYFDGYQFNRVGFEFAEGLQPKFDFDSDNSDLILAEDQYLYITDLNLDGLSDVMFFAQGQQCTETPTGITCPYSAGIGLSIYYSSGYSFVREAKVNNLETDDKLGYRFDLGDFNGDGIDDVLSTANNNDRFQMMYINKNTEELLLKEVSDGLNNRIAFDYKLMVDPEVYTITTDEIPTSYEDDTPVTSQEALFPYNKIVSQQRLLHQLRSPNGNNTGENVMKYHYKDAVYHRLGMGAIGYLQTTSINQDQNRTTIANAILRPEYALLEGYKSQRIVTSTDEVIGSATSRLSYHALLDDNQVEATSRYWTRIDRSKSKSFNVVNEKTYSYADDDLSIDKGGNVTSVLSTQLGELGTIGFSSLTEYSNYNSSGSIFPNKPGYVKVGRTRIDYDTQDPNYFEKVSTFQFYDEGTLKEKVEFVLETPLGPDDVDQQLTTSYKEIDEFGNPRLLEISAVDIETRQARFEYDETGRFVETSYNSMITTDFPLGQPSYTSYDTKWGAPLSIVSVDGNTSSMTHDPFGRAATVVTPSNYVIETDYHWADSSADPLKPAEALYYQEAIHPAAPDAISWHNSLGQTIRNTYEDFKSDQGDVFINAVDQAYDARGRMLSSTTPYRTGVTPLTTNYVYDEYNRSEEIITPTGAASSSKISYDYKFILDGTTEITVTDEDGLEQKSFIDAAGLTFRTIDSGGKDVYYNHNGLGQLNFISYEDGSATNNSALSSMTYDRYGRQTSLTEVNTGTTQYKYNSLGEIIYQKDARAEILPTEVEYDRLGRVIEMTKHEGLIIYEYVDDPMENGLNQIKKITNYNGVTESFSYDPLSRLNTTIEEINGVSFTHAFGYSAYDQLETETFPSGLKVSYEYHPGTGFLKYLKDHNNVPIYTPQSSNIYGQMTQYQLGNGYTTHIDMDEYGILRDIEARISETDLSLNKVFHMEFDFDIQNGVLNSRTDYLGHPDPNEVLTETFEYDDHYRLEMAVATGASPLTMSYDDNGNINSKSDISDMPYQYANELSMPDITSETHKVISIPEVKVPMINQSIVYDAAQQPISIIEGGRELSYINGVDNNRRYAKMTQNNDPMDILYERYYLGDYERQELESGVIQDIHYLDAGITVVREDGGDFDYYYTYGDYLGSINTVTDDQGTVLTRQSFDAWGRKRSGEEWSNYEVDDYNLSWLYRGYTGHEMVPEMDLINMNGRMYDPLIARMLSADNFAGQGGSSQSYNRYSYVQNNPLMYTDPSGENLLEALGNVFGKIFGKECASGNCPRFGKNGFQLDGGKTAAAAGQAGSFYSGKAFGPETDWRYDDIIYYDINGKEINRIKRYGPDVHVLDHEGEQIPANSRESIFGDRSDPGIFTQIDRTSVPDDNAVVKIIKSKSDGEDGYFEFASKSRGNQDYDYKNSVLGPLAGIDNSGTAYVFNGVLYNRNEIGNVLWGATAEHNRMGAALAHFAAQAFTIITEWTLDEPGEQGAIRLGRNAYNREVGKEYPAQPIIKPESMKPR